MNDSHPLRIRQLFAEALERPESERTAFIERACADDELRSEVLHLLALHRQADGFLNPGAIGDAVDEALAARPDPRVGSTVGRYRIVELIARGGMGVVYRAEQENPLRSVALKLIGGGLVSPELLRRFELEEQVLGRLQHPGIAQIFEAGTAETELGPQPFFAMEYIEGRTLTEYARSERLGTAARLELLIKVCDAVEHAHRKGVIHRDLKPVNILVDRTGQPKILDFGVARSTDSDLQVTIPGTGAGALIGTLPYMSPEQVQGRPEELDTRSDVYALGVLCYELLTGRLPRDLSGKTITDAIRTIIETEPRSLRSSGGAYPHDLETIAAKAMEGDRDRRYGSASELAADLRRFLNDEPIQAHPPSAVYQLRKFARRNRALVAGLALTVGALILGVAGTATGWVRANRAHLAARAESERSRVVSEFLQEMMLAPNPLESGRDVRVVDVIEQARGRIETEFAGQPDLQATLYEAVGETYMSLDLLEEARVLLERALRIRESRQGPPDADLIDSLGLLASLHFVTGELDRAEELSHRAVTLSERHLDEQEPAALTARHNLALIFDDTDRLDEAERLYRQVLERSRAVLGEQHAETLTTAANLGSLLRRTGRLEEARAVLQEVYANQVEVLGANSAESLTTLNHLAFLNFDLERYDEADGMFRRSLDLRRDVFGPRHQSTAIGMNNVGWSLVKRGRGDEAEPFLREALELLISTLGPEHPTVAAVRMNLGDALAQTGRLNEAETMLLECLPRLEDWVGPGNARTLRALSLLVEVYEKQGRPALAEPYRARLSAAPVE